MIQSTKPAFISGMIAALPSPAGVSAPVSDMPTVPFAGDHLLREKPARLGEPAAVVGLEGGVDQVGGFHPFADRFRQQARELFVQRTHLWGEEASGSDSRVNDLSRLLSAQANAKSSPARYLS